MTLPTPAELTAATGDRYEVGDLIAAGGMAAVFRAQHRALQSPVAIKVLPRDVVLSTVRLARFRREAALAARLSHPNIVSVFEFDVRNGIAYLVMPFIEGETLEARLRASGPLSYADTLTLLRQVGAALTFAHARGVVHRDVKPCNILFEPATGRWMLGDFGVAHAADQDAETITQSGAAVGTPAYMAPEQTGGSTPVDQRADLFALAAVAYEALTGKRPVWTDGTGAVAQALRDARHDVPADAARGIAAGLAGERDARPPTVDAWLGGVGPRRRSWRRAAVPLSLVAVAAGVVWLALGRGHLHLPLETRPAVAVLPFAVAGSVPGVSLDSILPQAFAWQLAMLPDVRVIGAPVIASAIERRFGREPQERDTLLALAAQLGATTVVEGQAEARNGRITIRVLVEDAATASVTASADTSGPVDSLHALVAGLVVQAFAEPAALERSGWSPSLPHGLPAIGAYFAGDRDFRRGAYEQAIEELDRVIALDSTYAPAYFKRMLAVMQFNPSSGQIHSALAAARLYAGGLDPVSRQLLAGYAGLVRNGDLKEAEHTFRDIVQRYPDAVDAWFALGELLFHFAPLLGTPLGEAQGAFHAVLDRDPMFAAPVGHLLTIAIAEGDDPGAQRYIKEYLTIDSTSVLADLVRAGDTLLYHRAAAPHVLASFPKRRTAFLQQVAFLASEFGRGPGERLFAARAVDELWRRAATQDEKIHAFRLRMAIALGAGREAEARQLLTGARAAGVPQDELDRWLVLSAVTPLPALGDSAARRAAAQRLRTTGDGVTAARWLAARWYLRRDSAASAAAERDLRRLAHDPDGTPQPLELSLLDDIDGNRRLVAGDTAGAVAAWQRATQRFNVEQVPFTLVGSLWPVRLELATVGLAVSPQVALDASGTFASLAGFVDQAAWPHVLPARATAALAVHDTVLAVNTYRHLLDLLNQPDGGGVARRDSAVAALGRIVQATNN